MPLTECAFEEIYTDTRQALVRHVRGKRRRALDAEDIVQEAVYNLWRVDIGNPTLSEARRYLFGVASHLVVDRWRRETRKKRQWRADATPQWREPLWHDDVTKAFEQLSPRDRSLLWLAHVEGYPHEDIAKMVGLRPAGVRGMLFRARARLHGRLNAFRASQVANA